MLEKRFQTISRALRFLPRDALLMGSFAGKAGRLFPWHAGRHGEAARGHLVSEVGEVPFVEAQAEAGGPEAGAIAAEDEAKEAERTRRGESEIKLQVRDG